MGPGNVIVADDSARKAFHRQIRPHLGWNLPDVASRQRAPRLGQLVDIYESVDDDRVPGAIIPLVRREPDRMSFALVADTASELRRITPLVVAAVGVTLTDFDGRPSRSTDPIDEILSEHGLETRTFATPPHDRERGARTVAALRRLVRTLRAMPIGPRELPRSTPQLLHEFDLAVQAGDRDRAFDRLRELENRRAVDALNLRFLTVRWHADFRQWSLLRREPWFGDLCRARRPPRVTAALLRCRYETDLGGGSALADPPALLERFRDRVSADSGNLFHDILVDPDGPTAIMFALDAVERGDVARLTALRHVAPEGWEPAQQTAFEEVLALDDAPVVVRIEPEPTRLETLRRWADGRPFNDAERAIIRGLAGADAPLTVTALAHSLTHDPVVEVPRADVAPDEPPDALPDDWVTDTWDGWFGALPRLRDGAAREIAARLADEVDVRSVLTTHADCEQFATGLERAASDHEEKVRSALPHLVRWLQGDEGWPTPEHAPLYRHLITALLIVDTRSVESLNVALSLLDGWLATGPESDAYAELLGEFRGELERLASDRTLDALIDLAELLVIHPAQDLNARAALWSELQLRLGRFQTWLSSSQITILNGICDVMGVGRSFEEPPTVPDGAPAVRAADWAGTIGLYTLRPAVRRRAVEALRAAMPRATIDSRDDRVATASLAQLAGRSDIMAIDWSAAKHAATQAIVDALGDREPLWVHGGASSIVSRVLGRIASTIGASDR